MQGLEAQVLQLQAALRSSEVERARQQGELEVLKAHLPTVAALGSAPACGADSHAVRASAGVGAANPHPLTVCTGLPCSGVSALTNDCCKWSQCITATA